MSTVTKRTWTTGKGIERTAWVVRYVDQAGRRRLRTFQTKGDAIDWETTARHEVKQGIHTPASSSITVADAAERWIENCEAEGLERGTVKQRREHLRLHIAPFIGRERLANLTMPGIYAFDGALRAAGRSLAMRRKVVTNLKTLLSFAQGQGLVAQNVARGVRVKGDDRMQPGPVRAGVDFPTREELQLMIGASQGRWRPLLVVAVFTGMRASELRGLTWADVDLDGRTIHVRRRADAWGTMGPPKSKAGSRDIPMTPMVRNALAEWRQQCPAGPLGLVFPTSKGTVESHQNILHRWFEPLQVACGLTRGDGAARYGFHSLRHAAASLFIAHLNWTPKKLQAVLGHSSIAMTFDRYGHLFDDHAGDREAMDRLEAAVFAA